MPELAEVETVKEYLAQHIQGALIIDCRKYRDNLRYEILHNITDIVAQTRIKLITRRAKFINIFLDNGYILTYHLGMSGRLTVKNSPYILQKHDHFIINLSDNKVLVFNDARRFGMIYCYPENELAQQKFLSNMAVEPLEAEFDADYLFASMQNKKNNVKNHLMNNQIVVGVGNIYAAESLFTAKIAPTRMASSVSYQEAKCLASAIKQVLKNAIESGGTSLRDFVGGDNQPGYFRQKLQVYGREGLPCMVCDNKISKIKQSGRSSYFCSKCQN